MEGGVYILLDIYFFEHLLISIAFLLSTIITWRLRKKVACEEEFKALTYISLGFFVGFIFYLLGGFAGAYIYQLPILPLRLHEEGIMPSQAAHIVFLYNTVFKAIYLIALYTALLLVAYGVNKLINQRCREPPAEVEEGE
ncbi:MAG: hypothetical protein DRJ35_04890 [Thermoprotei archaeon]|nr:MAG: hypothetical protein DRJ35_04890 [Thermoprotei archaeon]